MRRGWQVAGIVFFIIFGVILKEALSLQLHDTLGPGPGFFPFWLALLGMALSAVLFVQVSLPGQTDFSEAIAVPDGAALTKMLSIVGGLGLAALMLDTLGFRIVALVFCAVLLPVCGARNPVVIAVFSLLASFGVFHVFYHWLKVPLPIGTFGV
jgi:putative tricarboxylic transport membrane protein